VAVDDLSLQLQPGQLLALVGENGAGKTTTLAMISGRLVPDAGQARIAGFDVFEAPIDARKRLGYVAQDLALPPHLTIEEMAGFAAEVKGLVFDETELARLLRVTGLLQDRDRLIGELSHGMQRKAAWVVALVTRPSVLILDEGLAGLDATSSAAIVKEIGQHMKRGMAVLWTEHDLDLIAPLLTAVIRLRQGKEIGREDGESIRALARAGTLDQAMRNWTGGE
jgi:ABC-2 type transport system ATP-binding protein